MLGAAVGAVAIGGLHAQSKPLIYVVVEVNEVTNLDANTQLLHKGQARDAAAAIGGNFVVRTENITPLDGVAPKRFLLIAFDSVEKAKAWNASPAMKDVNEGRIRSTKSRSFIVDEM
jgi:uncharacterized protein (DUF1330 family)